jgi:hypothetical protein
MKLHARMTAYSFDCLDRNSIEECFTHGRAAGLRRLIDNLRGDIGVLTRLAEAIEAGESYDFGRDRIRTWWGWG